MLYFREAMVSLLPFTLLTFTEGKTYYCLQVHDILWNHRIIEEKKILLYSWHQLVGIGEAFRDVVIHPGKYEFVGFIILQMSDFSRFALDFYVFTRYGY